MEFHASQTQCRGILVANEDELGKLRAAIAAFFIIFNSMKKCVVLFFVAFFSLNCFSQNTKENFINTVNKEIFTKSRKTIYLDAKANGVSDTYDRLNEIKKEHLGTIAPNNIVNELYAHIKDTVTEYWDCQNLKKVTCISYGSFKSTGDIEAFYSVSKPIFSNDQKWCVVSVCGTDTKFHNFAWGELYLFHKVNGKWKKYSLSSWIT